MTGMAARNTSISRSKLGAPRFPFERPDVGDGYALPGPVNSRQMTPEERARYGPPAQPKDRDLRRGEVSFVVKHAKSLKHAARMARVSEARIKREMARHCVAVPESWEESEIMVENDVNNMPNNMPEPDSAGKAQEEKSKNRLERAREVLSREKYLELKEQGMRDRQINKDMGFNHPEILCKLKKEWGLEGYGKYNKEQSPELAPEKPAPKSASAMTISQAIARRIELMALIEANTNELSRINRVFEQTEIQL